MSKNDKIPKEILEKLARLFYPQIIEFYQSEEGQREYKEWKKQNNKKQQETTENND